MKTKHILLIVILALVATGFSVSAQTTRSFSGVTPTSTYVNSQARAGFQTYYGSNVNTYWPVLGDQTTCQARQDILLNVAPVGCQPVVVRSDLLAEQNVPVFCQIDALQINPLIDISQVRNIRFSGQYPPEVSGTGFHPARAALRTDNNLLGSPTPNNIGYVVVILKKQPDESKLPDSVNLTLSADIDYVSGNGYGIGRSEFILETQNDQEWETEKLKQSFWNGRYFVRLENVNANQADVSIYEGDKKVSTQKVGLGQTSPVFYTPGLYCQAGLQIAYDGFVTAKNKARIEVSSGNDIDSFDVYEGSRFLDDRCTVRSISIYNESGIGKVTGNCKGQEFVLELKTRSISQTGMITLNSIQYPVKENSPGEFEVTINNTRFTLEINNSLLEWTNGKATKQVSEDGKIINTPLNNENQDRLLGIRKSLIEYKTNIGTNAALTGNDFSSETNLYYGNAISSYEEIVDSYAGEREGQIGQEAMTRAISLARDFGKDNERRRLIEKLTSTYQDAPNKAALLNELNQLNQFDTSSSVKSIQFDDKARNLRLVSISEPKAKATAELIVENDRLNIGIGESKTLSYGGNIQGKITLDQINPEQVDLSAYCAQTNINNETVYSTTRQRISLTETGVGQDVCGIVVKLANANSQNIAKIRILPQTQGTRTATNFTVQIGIEKRAIKLTPEKTQERINELNKSIVKWEKISEQLGNVVTGLKTACFATSTILTFKNFASGLSGETLARQEVMSGDNGWRTWCQAKTGPSKEFTSLDACYLANSDKIDADVGKTTNAINSVNQKIQAIQGKHVNSQSVFGDSIDTEAMRADLANQIISQNAGTKLKIGTSGEEIPIETLLSQDNVKNGLVTTDEMRSIMMNLELQKTRGLNSEIATNPDKKLNDVTSRINDNININKEFEKAKAETTKGYPGIKFVGSSSQQTMSAEVVRLTPALRTETGFEEDSITHVAMVGANPGKDKEDPNYKTFQPGVYFLGLSGDPQRGVYNVQKVAKKKDDGSVSTPVEDTSGFVQTYQIGTIQATSSLSYRNKIDPSSLQCSYYENEPYRGMPAVVPFDTQNGWYAATKQTLPTFGGIGAFDASGRVTSFWLCNVGTNGRVEFETGFGDDLCQQVNLNTGQPLGSFPGLSEQEAKDKINQGVRAIQEASNQFGNKFITVNGQRCEVGTPSTGQPGTQCQDFMSPKDCNLMFNVCDPVVCPTSRCDFGGTYHVANVAQSGIVGSVLLCLPNIREKILIPVCLTGIQAGIDGFVSILRNHRDCLQESLDTGQVVGICDEIYSIYMCEFFWNQVAPLVNVLIPKLFEVAYGQGVRGGGEYLTVQAAWQNAQNSMNYFTQSYAANSIAAFQARSVEEVGTQFCQGFISAKAPTAFKTLVEPDSPPQFHAYFDAKTFSDVTVPATSQYKVFFHIFAGKDQGTNYNVYLKSPPDSSYYINNPYVPVASGFIPRGEYASQTKDFTAPEGYKELCVRINNDEKCGFGQVSTSFAVNYLRDSYVENQLTNTNIASEEECIGGSPNPGALLLNPNIQSGVEETINPQIYNRGVVRICGTQNPGLSTDPSRFVKVGTCGDAKIACWLDKQSVDKSITEGNLITRNSTLTDLNKTINTYLTNNGEILTPDQAGAEIETLQRAYQSLESKKGERTTEANQILNRIDSVYSQLFYGLYKSQALLIKGKTNEILARDWLVKDSTRIRAARAAGQQAINTNTGGGNSGTGSGGGSAQDSAPGSELPEYTFENSDRGKEILYNGQKTGIFYANGYGQGDTGVIAYDVRDVAEDKADIYGTTIVRQNGQIYIIIAGIRVSQIQNTKTVSTFFAAENVYPNLPEPVKTHLKMLNQRRDAPGYPRVLGSDGYTTYELKDIDKDGIKEIIGNGAYMGVEINSANEVKVKTTSSQTIIGSIKNGNFDLLFPLDLTRFNQEIQTAINIISTHPEIIAGNTVKVLESGNFVGPIITPTNVQSPGSGTQQLSGSCIISNARWELENKGGEPMDAKVGDTIYMVVDSQGCAGQQVQIIIEEQDLWPFPDREVYGLQATLEDGVTRVQYTIQSVPDAGSNFELRFKIGDARSDKLTVVEQPETEAQPKGIETPATVQTPGPSSEYFLTEEGEVIYAGNPTRVTIDKNSGIISAGFLYNGGTSYSPIGTVNSNHRITINNDKLIVCLENECAIENAIVFAGIEGIRGKFLQDDGQITDTQ